MYHHEKYSENISPRPLTPLKYILVRTTALPHTMDHGFSERSLPNRLVLHSQTMVSIYIQFLDYMKWINLNYSFAKPFYKCVYLNQIQAKL